MTIQQYLDNISKRYSTGISREHSYRGDLQTLLGTILPDILVTNEPARIKCGAPDYVLTKKDIPIGYIEAKDIGDQDLDGKKNNKLQFTRYKESLPNLIFTDYLDFHFYIDGELKTSLQLAEIVDGEVITKPENFEQFIFLIKNFGTHVSQSIKSSSKLSQMMAGKAKMLALVIEKALVSDEETSQNSTLREQMDAFKEILIHDINPKAFADIYAQTIAYGMFAARLHDKTLDDFSRYEAASLIPKSNPFLRKLFQYISGYDIDDRIEWIVSALADIFRATDVKALLMNFGNATQTQDPIIHFYENFLAEYDPKLRKQRGVWYTPEPVVDFIVRAVDDILKTEFNLPNGIADNSKTTIRVKTDIVNKNFSSGYKEVDKEVHKVQILDPATGTGTFLAQVITHIYNSRFKAMQGAWSSYVEKDLIPRLNGFELLMASYAMAHLKMDLLLTETGYDNKSAQRFKIYLTNSLEEYHPDTGTLFANWLSSEANEANHIKRDTPVMCVIGNPPYSVSSSNKGEWIENLMHDYKKNLNERNIQPLSDDYIKFIRYGQHYIEKNGEGILAYISNNSFIDGITHRQMRNNLLKTFSKIFILDLHGSSMKNETTPDKEKDENVFDIMQGVSINILIKLNKRNQNNKKCEVHHFDLFGNRKLKYKFLYEKSLESISWSKILPQKPYYFFIPKNYELEENYQKGFSISKFFVLHACGIVTARDNQIISFSIEKAKATVRDFNSLNENEFRKKYLLGSDSRDWTYEGAKNDIVNSEIQTIEYRPFDIRYLPYTPNSKGIISYPRYEIMKQMIKRKNISLLICKQQSTFDFQHIFISKNITDKCTISSQTKEAGYQFPLYIYPNSEENETLKIESQERTPNLDKETVSKIASKIGLEYTFEKEEELNTFSPIDILDYIYAVLHSPSYRETYKEFLKIDFPRVPYPKDKETFWQLVELGGELRAIHLLESATVENYITTYPVSGNNVITRKLTKTSIGYEPTGTTDGVATGRVWINDEQYFDNVPLVAWEFYIGGYQPAQKWLKDRKDRELSYDDILHYQKIIVALTETDRIMKEIDKIEIC